MKYLLDTCTFLWIINGSDNLSQKARDIFVDPINEMYLSAASSWEIAVKYSIGKLNLPEDPNIFVPSRRETYKIKALAIEETESLHSTKLPAIHHDPFDRIMVCQSIIQGMPIITPDKMIRKYPAQTIW